LQVVKIVCLKHQSQYDVKPSWERIARQPGNSCAQNM
jgi:hypothetical protein